MEPEAHVVIEVIGEGIADIGSEKRSDLPNSGIVPILLHKLCGKPSRMRVKRRPFAILIGKGLSKKVQFAKRQAFYNRSDAAVFVVDSEGGFKELKEKQANLDEGRNRVARLSRGGRRRPSVHRKLAAGGSRSDPPRPAIGGNSASARRARTTRGAMQG